MANGAKAVELGPPVVAMPGDAWLFPEQHQGAPFTEPGIVTRPDGTIVAVKAHRFRPGEENIGLPGYFQADIVPLIYAIRDEEPRVLKQRRTGVEAEFSAVRGDQPFDMYPGGQRLPIRATKGHQELLRNTAEVVSTPELTTRDAYRSLRRAVESVRDDLRPYGAGIDPSSARMQDVPTMEDITPDLYVESMVRNLGAAILKFIGTGIHEHRESHIGYAPIVAKYLRVLAPLMNLGLQSAPFGFGEQVPRLGEVLGNDELAQHDGRQIQSVRYLTRFAASSNGGIGRIITHSTLFSALAHADRLLLAGETNSTARQYGDHSDVRPRYDAPSPKHLDNVGRIELCVKDTSGLRFETLEAHGVLARAIVERLEEVAARGEAGMVELHREFPRLFGKIHDDDRFAQEQLPRTHRNAIEIAYDGAEAKLTNGLGEEVDARKQFAELVRFAQSNGVALPDPVKLTIANSLETMAKVRSVAKRYRDAEQLPSMRGYYETGIGTMSQWAIARAEALRERGVTDEATIMRSGTFDRVASFENYLNGK